MKKILVPTDFSPASKAGFESAQLFSEATEAELFALNIYPRVENNYSTEVRLSMHQEIEKKRASKMIQFIAELLDQSHSDTLLIPTIHPRIRCGNIVNEINAAAQEYDVDLIIIGTKAKHNLWEYLFGSVSTNLIKKTMKPVLIIPEGIPFKKPKSIAFANDFQVDEMPLKELHKFADIFGARVERVHINILPSDFSNLKEEVVEIADSESGKGKPVSTTVIRNISVTKGLDYFVKTHNIDLLALYLPQRTFAEDLLHRSVSKQLTLSSQIPLLIFKE
jgi:nucleotide-binding universal stress UspA family protein